MLRKLVRAVAFSILAWTAQAQTSELTTRDTGPKTLLESIFGTTGKKDADQPREEDRLDPDRPHFPEATTTVGMGRAILESGYTFTKKETSLASHSYPESLLRLGMFADWFEFRIGQNFLNDQRTLAGTTASVSGAQDLYLGVKLALTEQKGFLPATVLIPQMTVPTGSSTVTAGRVLPGLNIDLSWEVIKDFFGIEMLVANNQAQDDLGGFRHELATGLTAVFQVTKKLETFVEWDAFYPTGGVASAGSRNYAVGGLVYFISKNFEVDARAGAGLNSNSNKFLIGIGFAVRH